MSDGGTIGLRLEAGPAAGGSLFALAGSLSGADPGLPVGNLRLPLNLDAYFLQSLSDPTGSLLSGNFGCLDALGDATVTLTLPAGSDIALIGLTAHYAALVFDLAPFTPLDSSNAILISLFP